jgi:hypothetical protein
MFFTSIMKNMASDAVVTTVVHIQWLACASDTTNVCRTFVAHVKCSHATSHDLCGMYEHVLECVNLDELGHRKARVGKCLLNIHHQYMCLSYPL